MTDAAEKVDIKSLLPDELEAFFAGLGEKKYRAKQVFSWLSRGVSAFDEMTDLPKALRRTLDERCFITALRPLERRTSVVDGTEKLLWELSDGNTVETVVMSYKYGNTVCISSQVGCRQGCAFCASTIGGLVRNLTPSEMLDEILRSEIVTGKPLSRVVLMGIGEPLDNFDNVIKFILLVTNSGGRNMSMRHISLSTCGLTENFDRLAEYNLQLTLTVSLHAPDDRTRSALMPSNVGRGVDRLMDCCAEYFRRTGRRVSFEYAMIDGVNDTPRHAELLAQRAASVGAHVNLIPLNNVKERRFRASPPGTIRAFADILERAGVNVTVRRRLGSDVDASCGQLRRRRELEKRTEEA